ncbi:MAG: hypothetical protein ACI9OJ_001931 [Myxococcota bacterium]|jgi:hypothetical protein
MSDTPHSSRLRRQLCLALRARGPRNVVLPPLRGWVRRLAAWGLAVFVGVVAGRVSY